MIGILFKQLLVPAATAGVSMFCIDCVGVVTLRSFPAYLHTSESEPHIFTVILFTPHEVLVTGTTTVSHRKALL